MAFAVCNPINTFIQKKKKKKSYSECVHYISCKPKKLGKKTLIFCEVQQIQIKNFITIIFKI